MLVASFCLCSYSSSLSFLREFVVAVLWWVYVYDLLQFCVSYVLCWCYNVIVGVQFFCFWLLLLLLMVVGLDGCFGGCFIKV